jgi:outer membrane protein assembly factor BamB
MTIEKTSDAAPRKGLRLWPGVAAVVPQWLALIFFALFVPEGLAYGIIAGLVGGLLVVVWWLFFSRAPWPDRLGALVLMPIGMFAIMPFVHPSIANAGMGMLLPIFSIPVLSLALVTWAAASRGLSSGARRASMVGAILLGCGVFALVRSGGITGGGRLDWHWRWTPTPEERLLAQAADRPSVPAVPTAAAPSAEAPDEHVTGAGRNLRATPSKAAAAPAAQSAKTASAGGEPSTTATAPAAATTPAEWPGFRGPERDGVIRGSRIETDWSKSPPVPLWRRRVGPGWSSFAVRGDLIYTQEQRGADEIVACYRLRTGEPVWSHRDGVRFSEPEGGAGPRGTPTVGDGRVYTMGATGIVNALDADSGAALWSRNAAADTGAKVPHWGIASSPLLVDDLLIVAASGRLAAYEVATGKPRWFAQTGGGGYSSPQLVTIGGVSQVLLLSGSGATSVAPADGKQLWQHPLEAGSRIVQPALIAEGDFLMTVGGEGMGGEGVQRVVVAHGPEGWSAQERWTSRGLKPNFNDLVVHKGHAYGFDGSILACIDLEDGQRKWKGGRYGNGQLLLLADEDLLLVISEEGELALVKASPDRFAEVARFPAIEGKTWNHPVLVGDLLLVRNGEEMTALRLAQPGTQTAAR